MRRQNLYLISLSTTEYTGEGGVKCERINEKKTINEINRSSSVEQSMRHQPSSITKSHNAVQSRMGTCQEKIKIAKCVVRGKCLSPVLNEQSQASQDEGLCKDYSSVIPVCGVPLAAPVLSRLPLLNVSFSFGWPGVVTVLGVSTLGVAARD